MALYRDHLLHQTGQIYHMPDLHGYSLIFWSQMRHWPDPHFLPWVEDWDNQIRPSEDNPWGLHLPYADVKCVMRSGGDFTASFGRDSGHFLGSWTSQTKDVWGFFTWSYQDIESLYYKPDQQQQWLKDYQRGHCDFFHTRAMPIDHPPPLGPRCLREPDHKEWP